MRFVLIFILFFFFITSKAYSDLAKQIINNLENSENYSFKFIQQINDKKETGDCILVFDKKINCKYDNLGKILICFRRILEQTLNHQTSWRHPWLGRLYASARYLLQKIQHHR